MQRFGTFREPWVECSVCGFDYPLSQTRRNHKTKKLVDLKCDDTFSRGDYWEVWDMPREEITISPQRVPDQGKPVTGPPGAGEPGAGEGGVP
jgi:hypothetical protein